MMDNLWLYLSVNSISVIDLSTMSLSTRTPETINFPFGTNGKLMVLGVPIFKMDG